MKGIGTIANVAAVLLGGGAGLLLKGGMKERYQQIIMQALGLCTLFIGLSGVLPVSYTHLHPVQRIYKSDNRSVRKKRDFSVLHLA